jgi:hypothetical protein
MHQGRRPLIRRWRRVWAQAAAIVCVGVLGLVAVAAAAPKGGQGPPDHAQGNGPPPAPPRAGGNAQAKSTPAAGTTRPAPAPRPKPASGNGSKGGHAVARGNPHSQPAAGGTSGWQSTPQGDAVAQGNSGTSKRHASTRARSGKVRVCHATGSRKHAYVDIGVSANTVHAHARHPDARDIVPATGGCSAGAAQARGELPSGTDAPPATPLGRTPHSGDSPSGESDTLGLLDEGGAEPGADGGVLGADQGGGDDDGATAEATSASLPFTGLKLGLLAAMGATLALAGASLRRRAA